MDLEGLYIHEQIPLQFLTFCIGEKENYSVINIF